VDDLVDALVLGLENDRAMNPAFFVTDGERVSRGDFILAYMVLIETMPLGSMTARARVTRRSVSARC
jgi:hypothetical protein